MALLVTQDCSTKSSCPARREPRWLEYKALGGGSAHSAGRGRGAYGYADRYNQRRSDNEDDGRFNPGHDGVSNYAGSWDVNLAAALHSYFDCCYYCYCAPSVALCITATAATATAAAATTTTAVAAAATSTPPPPTAAAVTIMAAQFCWS